MSDFPWAHRDRVRFRDCVVASARSVLVAYDYEREQSVRIPAELRSRLETLAVMDR